MTDVKEKEKKNMKKTQKNMGKGKKIKRIPLQGKFYVKATFNNTIITATDINGNTLGWCTTGKAGFKGTRKSTPFAATQTAEVLAGEMIEGGMKEVDVTVSGVGMGRDASIRAIKNSGLKIVSLADTTPIPHNGCRPKNPRRV